MTSNKIAKVHLLKTPFTLLAEGEENGRTWAHIKVPNASDVAPLLLELSNSGSHAVVAAPDPELLSTLDKNSSVKTESLIAFLDLSALNKVIEHRQADQVISVETGLTVGQLDTLLSKSDQWWPLAAPAESTIYDVIVGGDGGFLEHSSGGPRNLVLGLQTALANGTCIKSGGKVVKNVTGYDTTKLFVGSQGALGIPVSTHLRLAARPEHVAQILVFADEMEQLIDWAHKVVSSGLPCGGVELIDRELFADDRVVGNSTSALLSPMPSRCAMVISLFEHKRVIDEVLGAILALLPPDAKRQAQDYPFRSPFDLYANCRTRSYVEFPASISQTRKFLKTYAGWSERPSLSIRPGCGRVRMFCRNVPEGTALIERLRTFSREQKIQLAAAYIDPPHTEIFHLPVEDDAAAQIKASLKERFDPSRCMNPFVHF